MTVTWQDGAAIAAIVTLVCSVFALVLKLTVQASNANLLNLFRKEFQDFERRIGTDFVAKPLFQEFREQAQRDLGHVTGRLDEIHAYVRQVNHELRASLDLQGKQLVGLRIKAGLSLE